MTHIDGFAVPRQGGYTPAFSRPINHSTPIERPSDPTMDPFSLSTGTVGLSAVALKLVVSTLGMTDKAVAAHNEAANELKGLQQDLEQLQTQMIHIHRVLEVLASNTKDRGFYKLLRR